MKNMNVIHISGDRSAWQRARCDSVSHVSLGLKMPFQAGLYTLSWAFVLWPANDAVVRTSLDLSVSGSTAAPRPSTQTFRVIFSAFV